MSPTRKPSNGASSVPYVSSDPNRTENDRIIAGKNQRIDAALQHIYKFLRDIDPNPTLDRLASYLGARSVMSLDTRTSTKYIHALSNSDVPESPLVRALGGQGEEHVKAKPGPWKAWLKDNPPPPQPRTSRRRNGGDNA